MIPSAVRIALAMTMGAALTARAGAWDEGLDSRFKDPPNRYRLIQYAGHGTHAVPVEMLREYGVGGVKLFLSSHDYLKSDAGWQHLAESIEQANEAGLRVWLGDDNGYPSGMAGGLVVEADPAYEVRGLFQVAVDGEGPRPARLDLPPGAEAFVHAVVYPLDNGAVDLDSARPARVGRGRVETDGLDGPWTLRAFALKVIDEGTQAMDTAQQFQTSGRYPNLLNEGAMETFVDITHAEYSRRMGPLDDKLDVVYTNEPNLMTLYFRQGSRPGGEAYVPWDEALPGRFMETRGYDLMPRLAALFGGDDDASKLVRRHFYQTVGDTLVDNFSGRIARWAEQNGVRSGGHLLLEEYTAMHVICYGDFLRVLMEQHVPGCDIPMPDLGAQWNYWMPKYISSAAYLRGRETVSALLDPIIGRPQPVLEPAPEDFRRIINMAFLTGVNQISTYIRWSSYEPGVYRGFNEYVGRLALMLRGAANATTIAMYYPIETFQAAYTPSPEFWSPIAWRFRDLQRSQDETARLLLERGYDFNYLNADAVLAAELDGGRLTVGAHVYDTVVMPAVELAPLAVLRKLQDFEAAGGTVLWVDALPRLGDAPEEHGPVREAAAGYEAIRPADVPGRIGNAYPEAFQLRIDGPEAGFFAGRFAREGSNLYLLVNNTGSPAAPYVDGDIGGPVRVYDPLDGTIADRTLPATLSIEPFSTLIVVETP